MRFESLYISKLVEFKLMKMFVIPFKGAKKIKARPSQFSVYQGWRLKPVFTGASKSVR